MRTISRWLRDGRRGLKHHYILCASLLLVGFVAGLSYRPAKIPEPEKEPAGVSTERAGYSKLTNAELKSKTVALVTELRSFAGTMRKEDTDAFVKCDGMPANSDSEWRRRQQCYDETALADRLHTLYNERYETNAILLLDELLKRLPPEYRSKIGPPVLFEHPTNFLGLEKVATSLDLLAKSLPEQ